MNDQSKGCLAGITILVMILVVVPTVFLYVHDARQPRPGQDLVVLRKYEVQAKEQAYLSVQPDGAKIVWKDLGEEHWVKFVGPNGGQVSKRLDKEAWDKLTEGDIVRWE